MSETKTDTFFETKFSETETFFRDQILRKWHFFSDTKFSETETFFETEFSETETTTLKKWQKFRNREVSKPSHMDIPVPFDWEFYIYVRSALILKYIGLKIYLCQVWLVCLKTSRSPLCKFFVHWAASLIHNDAHYMVFKLGSFGVIKAFIVLF